MKFSDAYIEMLKGYKMTRPCFKGYWYINGKSGKLVIHLENGNEITEGDLTLTAQNTIAEDWDHYFEPICSLSRYFDDYSSNYPTEIESDSATADEEYDYTDGIGDEYVYVGDPDVSAMLHNTTGGSECQD